MSQGIFHVPPLPVPEAGRGPIDFCVTGTSIMSTPVLPELDGVDRPAGKLGGRTFMGDNALPHFSTAADVVLAAGAVMSGSDALSLNISGTGRDATGAASLAGSCGDPGMHP